MCILIWKTHLSKFGFAKLDLSTPLISMVKEIREGDQTTEIFRDLKEHFGPLKTKSYSRKSIHISN